MVCDDLCEVKGFFDGILWKSDNCAVKVLLKNVCKQSEVVLKNVERDFMVQKGRDAVPIEVKAETNTQA